MLKRFVHSRSAEGGSEPCLVEVREFTPWGFFITVALSVALVAAAIVGGTALERTLPGWLGTLAGIGFIFLCLYLLVRLVLWYWRKGRSSRRYPYSAASAMHSYIAAKGLYETDDEGRVTASARFLVYENAETIEVTALKDPLDKWFAGAGDYGDELAALFGLPVFETKNEITRCVYRFRKAPERRLFVRPEDFAQLNPVSTSVYPLTSELSWNIAQCPHALITGATGGGKSAMLNYLMLSLLRDRAHLFVSDPKRSDLYNILRPILGGDRVASTPGQIAGMLRRVVEIMEERYAYMEEHYQPFADYRSYPEIAYPVVLIADEMAAMFAEMDKSTRAETESRLLSVLMKGRQSGVFAILATQQPRSDVIRTDIREQLFLRISLGAMGKEGYAMTFSTQGQGYDFAPREGKGTGYLYLDDGTMQQPRPFDAPWLDPTFVDVPATARKLVAELNQAEIAAKAGVDGETAL